MAEFVLMFLGLFMLRHPVAAIVILAVLFSRRNGN